MIIPFQKKVSIYDRINAILRMTWVTLNFACVAVGVLVIGHVLLG